MPEFKINSQIKTEIGQLLERGQKLAAGTELSDEGVSTLDTAQSILMQHQQIGKLLEDYQALVSKDTAELDRMIETAQQMDAALGESMSL